MRDCWYYSGPDGQVGPIALEQLKKTLATHPSAKDMYIWHDSFPEWVRAGDLVELVAQATTAVQPTEKTTDKDERQAADDAPRGANDSLSLERFHPDRAYALTQPPPISDDASDRVIAGKRRWTSSGLLLGAVAILLGCGLFYLAVTGKLI
jgi:hypothetical protein